MSKPIRILQVFTILNRGGAESMIMNYYRNIDRTKVQFDFLVHREEKGVFEDEIVSLGGEIYRVKPINPLFPKKYYVELNELLSKHKFKIIHSHINTFSYYPLKFSKKNNIPVRIAHAHTTTQRLSINSIIRNPKESLKILFKSANKNLVNKEATHLFACGGKAGNWLFGSLAYKILPNAIDVSKYKYNLKKREELRENFGINNQFVIGHVGNFSHPKNYPFIINVFKHIKTLHANSKLVLIGGGQLESEVKVLAKSLGIIDDVIFLGVRSDVPDLMQMIDVFIFPSYYEGLPVTLIEAQASGLKIFASDTITNEITLTKDISFLSLKLPYEIWANKIINDRIYIRKNNCEILKDGGYDIQSNAEWLQNFYLMEYNK